MRRTLFMLFVLCGTTSLFAADRGTIRFSGFAVNGNKSVQEWDGSGNAYAAAVDYWWNPHLSSALTISDEPVKVTRFQILNVNGEPVGFPYTKSIHLHPADGSLRYHFVAGSRFDPYLGAGIRYVSAEGTNNWRTELEGGLTFALTRHLGVTGNYKRLYRQDYQATRSLGSGNNALPVDMTWVEGRRSRSFLGLSWTF